MRAQLYPYSHTLPEGVLAVSGSRALLHSLLSRLLFAVKLLSHLKIQAVYIKHCLAILFIKKILCFTLVGTKANKNPKEKGLMFYLCLK